MSSDFAAGATAGMMTDTIFYSLDSYKVMRQAGDKIQVNRLFRGLPFVLVSGSGPSFGIFFGIYGPIKSYLMKIFPDSHIPCSTAASIIGGTMSSIAGVPSDVIKKRVVLGVDSSAVIAFSNVIKVDGISGLFLGWRANLVKDIPFAALKLTLYEAVWNLYLKGYKHEFDHREPNIKESAIVGLISGGITGILTCPLDVVNTRIKSGELSHLGLIEAHVEVAKVNGIGALFRGLGPRVTIMSLGSLFFWSLFAKSKEFWSQI